MILVVMIWCGCAALTYLSCSRVLFLGGHSEGNALKATDNFSGDNENYEDMGKNVGDACGTVPTKTPMPAIDSENSMKTILQ